MGIYGYYTATCQIIQPTAKLNGRNGEDPACFPVGNVALPCQVYPNSHPNCFRFTPLATAHCLHEFLLAQWPHNGRNLDADTGGGPDFNSSTMFYLCHLVNWRSSGFSKFDSYFFLNRKNRRGMACQISNRMGN